MITFIKKIVSSRDIKRLKIANNRGAALIFSYLLLSVLLVLMSGFAFSTSSELSYANRFRDSATAFWLAEAGINRFLQDTTLLDAGNQTIYFGTNTVTLTKDDTDPLLRIVNATGTVNGISRKIQIEFPGTPPEIFDNTMSTGGNITLNGLLAKMDVFGPTRITGTYIESGFGADGWFEDKQEGLLEANTTLKYPDSDSNGTADQFNDFVTFNQTIVSTYPANEVVYIQSDNTQVITPNSSLAGIKVLFVEGSSAGTGDVDILFDASWQSGQNLTIISTGTIEYIQPLQTSSDSQLNIIAWDGYTEASVFYSAHKGVTYSHSDANFYSIFQYSETTGNLIANSSIVANEALAWKKFLYGNPIVGGLVPSGFEGLITLSTGGYSATPSEWKEI